MNTVRAFRTILGLSALLLIVGCGSKRRQPSPSSGDASATALKKKTTTAAPKPLRRKPKTAAELPTTDADIYLGNLDGQLGELTRLVNERPEITPNLQRLGASHHTRGRFRGDLDDLQLGIDFVSKCIKLEPDNGSCYLMRGEQEQSLHRFKEARADLERARQLPGIDPMRSIDLQTELDWNDGRYDTAIAAIRKARLDRPSTATWMREAQLDQDLGLEQDAIDAKFEAAEDLINDTAPLAVAHLNVQRGIQRSQRGLLEEACLFFREAVARIPTYVAANEHLAEALHTLGKDDEAIAIYEKVVKSSQDPEFMHALAELYSASSDETKKKEARALQTRARTGYEALLKKYPEAMYWHASEFYVASGDTKRALDLLRKNLALRPNSTSYVALARAELANGLTKEAKTSIDKALAMPVVSASLFWTASRIARQSGDATAADGFRDRAKRLNPRIDIDEPAVARDGGAP